ncbi:MAG TPA: antibiotic biosynthesis monooxygenase family protein [Flavipsychrobacter sp.]|nr:antibiotic biosynthesis monooxygenase family protein [Flavipsychrobacter sp.]
MIKRIVQMTFREEEIDNFLNLFQKIKQRIKAFDGCHHLELWQDTYRKNVFFTYSIWESETHLDHYRFSEFFKETWVKTKVLFAENPHAWSVIQKDIADK